VTEGLNLGRYAELREEMLPGDVVAFGGTNSRISELIKYVTRGPVSHVGVILHTRTTTDDDGRFFNLVLETVSLNGHVAVAQTRLSVRAQRYEGDIWWLPLSAEARNKLNLRLFWDWCMEQEGKPYDYTQAWRAGIDSMDWTGWTYNEEDFSRLFCSELVAGALEAGGVLPSINASEFTPLDVCRLQIFSSRYYQIAGDQPKPIPWWNTVVLKPEPIDPPSL
jgi:hypothetical protein